MTFWKKPPDKIVDLENPELQGKVNNLFRHYLKKVVKENSGLVPGFSGSATRFHRSSSTGWFGRSRRLNSSNFYAVMKYTRLRADKDQYTFGYFSKRGRAFEQGKTTSVTDKMRALWGLQANVGGSPLKKGTTVIKQPSRPFLGKLGRKTELFEEIKELVEDYVTDELF